METNASKTQLKLVSRKGAVAGFWLGSLAVLSGGKRHFGPSDLFCSVILNS